MLSGGPGALAGQRRLGILPIDFRDVRVGNLDEARYLSSKTPQQQQMWASDKSEISARFLESLTEEAAKHGLGVFPATGATGGGETPVVMVRAVRLEPGYYIGIDTAPAILKLDVVILGGPSREIEHVLLDDVFGSGFSVTQRFSRAGTLGGRILAEHLAQQAGL